MSTTSELTRVTATLAEKCNVAQESVLQSRNEHATRVAEYKEQHEKYLALHQILRACEQELAKARASNSTLRENSTAMRNKIAHFEADLKQRKDWIAEEEQRTATMKATMDKLAKTKDMLAEQLSATGKQAEQLQHERRLLEDRIKAQEVGISHVRSTLAATMSDCERHGLVVEDLRALAEREQTTFVTLSAALSAAQSKRSELEVLLGRLKQDTAETTGKLEAMQSERRHLTQAIASAQHNVDQASVQDQRLQRELSQVQEEAARLRHFIATLEQQKSQKDESIEAKRREKLRCHDVLSSLRRVMEEKDAQLQQVQSEATALNKQHADMMEQKADLEARTLRLQEQLSDATSQLQRLQDAVKEGQAALATKEAQMQKLMRRQGEKQRLIEHTAAHVNAVRTKLEKAEAAVTTLNRKEQSFRIAGRKRARYDSSSDDESSMIALSALKANSMREIVAVTPSPEQTSDQENISPASQETAMLVAERYVFPKFNQSVDLSTSGPGVDVFNMLYGQTAHTAPPTKKTENRDAKLRATKFTVQLDDPLGWLLE